MARMGESGGHIGNRLSSLGDRRLTGRFPITPTKLFRKKIAEDFDARLRLPKEEEGQPMGMPSGVQSERGHTTSQDSTAEVRKIHTNGTRHSFIYIYMYIYIISICVNRYLSLQRQLFRFRSLLQCNSDCFFYCSRSRKMMC